MTHDEVQKVREAWAVLGAVLVLLEPVASLGKGPAQGTEGPGAELTGLAQME